MTVVIIIKDTSLLFYSQWPSYYPYYGGRFALDGEADEIFVTQNSRQNTITTPSDKGESPDRKEQGWYFPRDGHPEIDLIHTNNDTYNDYYNPASSTRASNYASYNGLMHGYYDARTGTQISPSIRNYLYSGVEADNIDGFFENELYDLQPPYPFTTKDETDIPPYEDDATFDESHLPPDATHNGWFTPYAYPNENVHKPISSLDLTYNREQEILLKPSLPRHSSMKPSAGLQEEMDDMPFDPSLSTVRETDTPYHQEVEYYNFPQSSVRNPSYTSSHKQNGSAVHSHNNSYRSNLSPVHVVVDPYIRQYPITQQNLDFRGSNSSSINDIHPHYNRDRLLGTVDRVRNNSRAVRNGSYVSAHSQHSPPTHPYRYSPFLEQEPERYPELTSPTYYNRNNNRSALPPLSRQRSTSPRQALSQQTASYQTSGLGTTWSNSRIDNSTQTSRPLLSSSSGHWEYDISNNHTPNYRYFGLYARPKTPSYCEPIQEVPSWSRYNSQHYVPSEKQPAKPQVSRSASDSVDENYEFDPVLIDAEPQDFFHTQHDDYYYPSQNNDSSHFPYRRPPLYAEQRQNSHDSEAQRFEKLRQEYLSFREQQNQAMKHVRLQRLESDIL